MQTEFASTYLGPPHLYCLSFMPLFRRILAPFDFSDVSAEGVRFARELASSHGADVTVVHVVQEPTFPSFYKLGALRIYGMVPDAEKLAWRALEKRFGDPEGHPGVSFSVVKGEADAQIIRQAERGEFDLIVISSHGLTGLEHVLLGSVAEKVVRNAPCPVLVVKTRVSKTTETAVAMGAEERP